MSFSKVIAIDGQAYVGKSHIARGIAAETGFEFINTGHMYRALANLALCQKIDLTNEQALLAIPYQVWFESGKTMVSQPGLAGAEDWTDKLDDPRIVQAASQIAVLPKVRERLTKMQRDYSKKDFIIMEGRDIGTTVFPDAVCRIYLAADALVRAKRLYKTLPADQKRKYPDPPSLEIFEKLRDEKLNPIDELDTHRKISPLISLAEAQKLGYYIHLSPEEYTVADDVRDIYQKYVKPTLDGAKL